MKRYFLLLFTLLLVTYYPVVSAPQIVNPDAVVIFPNLESFKSLWDYFQGLLEFKTIDLQPVRDLSLWVDAFFFKTFSLQTSIFQNILWWTVACFFIFNIITKVFPRFKRSTVLLIVFGFAFYPLFSSTLCWGMARKHILAFLFLVIALDFLLTLNRLSSLNSIKFTFLYVLSLLSQPIHLLFPLWAGVFLFINKKQKNAKEVIFFLLPSFVFMLVICYLNLEYFHKSPMYLSNYSPKASLFDFDAGDFFLALGHYHFQLFLPYFLSFEYSLGNSQVLWGLGIFIGLILLVFKKADLKSIVWLLLGYLSLFLVLTNPHFPYDTYLLGPALALLIFFLGVVPAHLLRSKLVPCFFFVLWGAVNFYESHNWTNSLSFTEINFKRHPNCKSAINFQSRSYLYNDRVSPELKSYIVNNQCIKIQSANLKNSPIKNKNLIFRLLLIESHIYLFEKDIDFLQREEGLRRLSTFNYYYLFYHAIFYINEGHHLKADNVIKKIINEGKGLRVNGPDRIIEKYLHPYCSKKKWKECSRISSLFLEKKDHYW